MLVSFNFQHADIALVDVASIEAVGELFHAYRVTSVTGKSYYVESDRNIVRSIVYALNNNTPVKVLEVDCESFVAE